MKRISLALTHYNRAALLLECVAPILEDQRISEIVISDDASTDGSYLKLLECFSSHPKVKVFQNAHNLDCYQNKAQALRLCSNEWAILFDSDNILPVEYLDCLYRLLEWKEDTVYCPDFAEPYFDYTAFAGREIDQENVAKFMAMPHFATALNTCNYFVHRNSYLEVWDGSVNPHTADSIFQMYNWFRHGKKMQIVPGLRYFHRIHSGSHYKQNVHKTGDFSAVVESRLKALI